MWDKARRAKCGSRAHGELKGVGRQDGWANRYLLNFPSDAEEANLLKMLLAESQQNEDLSFANKRRERKLLLTSRRCKLRQQQKEEAAPNEGANETLDEQIQWDRQQQQREERTRLRDQRRRQQQEEQWQELNTAQEDLVDTAKQVAKELEREKHHVEKEDHDEDDFNIKAIEQRVRSNSNKFGRTSQYRAVHWDAANRIYRTQFLVPNEKSVSLGKTLDEIEAAKRYDDHARATRGEAAHGFINPGPKSTARQFLNFPTAVGVTLDLYYCREVLTLTLHCREKKLDCRQMSSK